jgi:hypothetical protein
MPAETSSRIWKTVGFQYMFPFELPSVDAPRPDVDGEVDKCSSRKRTEFSWGLVAAVCPPQLVERVIEDCGRREQRHRLLPAVLVVYGLLLRCWYQHLGYQRVLRLLQHSALSPRRWQVPCASAFLLARDRLGPEVMKRLFLALAGPLAEPGAEGCWWRGRRLMAIDGTTVEVAPTDEFESTFGGPQVEGTGRKGRPQVRLTALIECGTRAIADLAWGPYGEGEASQARRLLGAIRPGMLLLADRNFRGVELWQQFVKAGADLLWRADSYRATKVIEYLSDGTCLARMRSHDGTPVVVRVIAYQLFESKEVYRLITNMLDPKLAPAAELAALYAERWEIETCFRELKVTQCAVPALPSKSPERVEQDLWANAAAYQIARHLAYRAASSRPDFDCDRISFTAVLDALRGGLRMMGHPMQALRWAIAQLTAPHSLLKRRNRTCPRIALFRWRKYRSRDRYPGPKSSIQERRPTPLICA